MDKIRQKNIWLGVFVIAGLGVFITGLFFVGSKNELFTKTFTITAKFSNANGLKPGSNVRFNGVKAGIVKSVHLISDTLVQVDMQIEESKRRFIFNNAVASIVSDGLMGDKMVNVVAGNGTAPAIRNNDVIPAHNPIATDKILQTLYVTNENVKVISENLRKLTGDLNTQNGTIQSLYKDPDMAQNLRESFKNLNAVSNKVLMAGNALQQITTQIQKGNGLAGEIIYDTMLGKKLTHTLDNLKETSDQLIGVTGQLSTTLRQADSGKGTINMLLSDTTFSGNLEQSIVNIKSASVKLDQNMEAFKHNFLTRRYFRKKAKKEKKMVEGH